MLLFYQIYTFKYNTYNFFIKEATSSTFIANFINCRLENDYYYSILFEFRVVK